MGLRLCVLQAEIFACVCVFGFARVRVSSCAYVRVCVDVVQLRACMYGDLNVRARIPVVRACACLTEVRGREQQVPGEEVQLAADASANFRPSVVGWRWMEDSEPPLFSLFLFSFLSVFLL